MADSLTFLVWLGKLTALPILAMGVAVVLRRAPASARYVVWFATLVALLLVPPVSIWSPLPVRVLPSDASSGRGITLQRLETGSPKRDAVEPIREAGNPSPSHPPPAKQATSVPTILLLTWIGIVTIVLAWIAIGATAVRRIVAGARMLNESSWLDPLYEAADRLGLEAAPRLMMASNIEMPFACGLLRPTIVVPASAEQWNEDRRRVVLLHELAHIRRRDLVGHTIGRIVCAFYWFHPLVWSAARQLRAESERACDDLVLDCGARASDYADHLLDIVMRVGNRSAPATVLPMANKREFEGRLLAILDPGVRRAAPRRGQTLMVALGLGAVAFSIAAVAPARRQPPVRQAVAPQNQSRDTTNAATTSVAKLPKMSVSKPTTTEAAAPTASSSPATMPSNETEAPQHRQSAEPDTALLANLLRNDNSAEVRRAAAWALRDRREGVPLLLERLRVDASDRVREMSAWALADFMSDNVASSLTNSLLKDSSPYVRGTAAWALGHLQDAPQTAALEAALADADWQVRQKALWALAESHLETAPARVIELLRDDASEVRTMAAWLLAGISDKSSLSELRVAFDVERDNEAQKAEFIALVVLGGGSKEVVDRALASENASLRAMAVRLMAGQAPYNPPRPWPDSRARP